MILWCYCYSGFLFLRLICPALIDPLHFNLLSSELPLLHVHVHVHSHIFWLSSPSSLPTLSLSSPHSILPSLPLPPSLQGNPSESSSRSLKLVAKAVQNLASLVEFKTKEPFMTSLNPFIIKNMPDMIKFIDKLSVSATCRYTYMYIPLGLIVQ